ncbi:MAG: hypothetical protein EKK36_01965 [Bradyrhizobiaceae bacterium]|nr:MAG: hypothetical protein EKK36_01965 [Bradyrhizobiaceae bacterium]
MRTVCNILGVIIALTHLFPAQAATVSILPNKPYECTGEQCYASDFQLFGKITSSTPQELTKLMDDLRRQAKQEGKQLFFKGARLWLSSQGGLLDAAYDIGRLLRRERMTAGIASEQECDSSCVFILAGAVDRLIFGRVGIHQPYLVNVPSSENIEKVRKSYQATLLNMKSYLREMNTPEGLAEQILKIPASNVRYLTKAELADYGLSRTDPVEQELRDIEDSRRYGTDRPEFLRRKLLAETVCKRRLHDVSDYFTCLDYVQDYGKEPPPYQIKPKPDLSTLGTPVQR